MSDGIGHLRTMIKKLIAKKKRLDTMGESLRELNQLISDYDGDQKNDIVSICTLLNVFGCSMSSQSRATRSVYTALERGRI